MTVRARRSVLNEVRSGLVLSRWMGVAQMAHAVLLIRRAVAEPAPAGSTASMMGQPASGPSPWH
jgi:hypothetical protein